MRVLIVDDNEELLGFLALSLKEADVDVVCIKNPDDALHKVEGEKFDALVVDSLMGNTDGIELVQRIRGTKNGRSVPILLMSTISTALARRMATTAGCNEFLVKPFGPLQFVELVKRLR
jgi:two-component system chemotaxis response regulator CheY